MALAASPPMIDEHATLGEDAAVAKGTHGGRREGAGRKPIGPAIQIDLPPEVVTLYDMAAQERGTTRAGLMREVLEKHAPR